jgi:hypothetical protein
MLLRCNCVFADDARAHAFAGEVHDAVLTICCCRRLHVMLLHVAGAAHAVARIVHDAITNQLLS